MNRVGIQQGTRDKFEQRRSEQAEPDDCWEADARAKDSARAAAPEKPKSQRKHLWTALPGQSAVRPRHDARGGALGRRERQKR
eukprot:2106469-Alexandrium_andersonii.AAC.1